jgi:glutaminase
MSNLENPEILPTALLDILKELHSQYKSLKEGVVVNYIPKLAKVNPDLFSICIVTTDGQIYEVGDFQQLVTIQSISKVFVYRRV